jgi:hypothetical protein
MTARISASSWAWVRPGLRLGLTMLLTVEMRVPAPSIAIAPDG